jgi:hypothetical protein
VYVELEVVPVANGIEYMLKEIYKVGLKEEGRR